MKENIYIYGRKHNTSGARGARVLKTNNTADIILRNGSKFGTIICHITNHTPARLATGFYTRASRIEWIDFPVTQTADPALHGLKRKNNQPYKTCPKGIQFHRVNFAHEKRSENEILN